jgi:hypothetical protein
MAARVVRPSAPFLRHQSVPHHVACAYTLNCVPPFTCDVVDRTSDSPWSADTRTSGKSRENEAVVAHIVVGNVLVSLAICKRFNWLAADRS